MRRSREISSRGSLLAVLAGALLAAQGAGCGYLADRGRDLGDIVSLGISDGGSVLARAGATRFVRLEAGARHDETFYGLRQRRFHWVESSYGLPFAFFWTPRLGQQPFEKWMWTDIFRTSSSKLIFPEAEVADSGDLKPQEWSYHLFVLTGQERLPLVDAFDVEADLGALIGGVQVVLSPGQLVDFLAGVFTLDPAGDDGEPEGEPPLEEEG